MQECKFSLNRFKAPLKPLELWVTSKNNLKISGAVSGPGKREGVSVAGGPFPFNFHLTFNVFGIGFTVIILKDSG